jgi:DNA-binding response OmpR family regulator
MSPASRLQMHADSLDMPSVVVVDSKFDAYGALVASARRGRLQLHLRSSGAEALRLNRRITVDAWLVASDLDDMSGHDLVELLKGDASGSPVAMIVDSPDGRRRALDIQAAIEAGADDTLTQPITLGDLERLLGMTVEERAAEFATKGVRRPFATLPVGIGAAVIAVAVLMIG